MSLLPGKKRAEHQRERWDRDWYVEPHWCSKALFATLKKSLRGPVHDPCCGEGRIVEAARRAGFTATGSDIADRGFGETGVDFLADMTPRTTLVFNPPGKPPGGPHLADLFIAHALEVASFAVAVIVPLPYLAGQARYHALYARTPPCRIFICSRRPSMPPGGTNIPEKGGTTDYCWLVWKIGWEGHSATFWLPP